jgi:hypothetical protein
MGGNKKCISEAWEISQWIFNYALVKKLFGGRSKVREYTNIRSGVLKRAGNSTFKQWALPH